MELLRWKYGALDDMQELNYIRAKFSMLRKGSNMSVDKIEEEILCQYISESQIQIRMYVYEQLIKCNLAKEEALARSSSCVSQRDIQRVFIFYTWLLKSYAVKTLDRQICNPQRQAVFVSLALVYYLRLPFELRKRYCEYIDKSQKGFEGDLTFQQAWNDELTWYIDRVTLPPGIAKTDALKENMLATILCCITKTPLIIEGAPGTSKTLSFNIAVANLKGSSSKQSIFQETNTFPCLEPVFYQCSRRTTSSEVETVFKRALNMQRSHNNRKSPQLSVVFMDEAGLPEQAHESLKVLHFYLEHPITSFVAITNHPLDAAKTNRAVSVFRPESTTSCLNDDLRTLARDCIGSDDWDQIEGFCNGYAKLRKDPEFVNFYGLRDFMYFLIYLRRHFENPTELKAEESKASEFVIRSLERNFGGVKPSSFSKVCEAFQMVMSIMVCIIWYEMYNLLQPKEVKHRSVMEILSDSLKDHYDETLGGEHSSIQGDIRYQLIIDTSVDESLSRYLFVYNILEWSKTKMFVCSSFPGDVHGSVCGLIIIIIPL